MKVLLRFSPLLFCFGCDYSEPYVATNTIVSNGLEEMSAYDYNYYIGHNAAVSQFGSDHNDLFVNLENKRVIRYASDNEEIISRGYVDGYHKALDIISNRNNPQCPDLH